MNPRRSGIAVGGGVCAIMVLAASLEAQQPGVLGGPGVAALPANARRVPTYYGQLGLTDEQRARIYAIRGPYQMKIAALEADLERLKAEELAACESVLSEGQRRMLSARRLVAKKSRGGVRGAVEAAPLLVEPAPVRKVEQP
jgi:Spy/CpxP family protein refolding chaperone